MSTRPAHYDPSCALCRENESGRVSADPVNPAHYHGDLVMRIIEHFHLDFCDGQVLKYILRSGHKPGEDPLREYRKAIWYLSRKVQQLEKPESIGLQFIGEPGK